MKKLILTFICLFGAQSTLAKSQYLLQNIPCTNEVLGSVQTMGVPLKWESPKKGVVTSKTNAGGVITLVTKKDESILSYNASDFQSKLSFKTPECKLKVLNLDNKKFVFNDDDLNKLLKENKRGLIYLWSPHMSLSVYELVEMKEYAKSLSLPTLTLLDLNADMKFSKELIEKYKLSPNYLKRMNSRELEKFGATVHYPSTILYKDGKLVKRVPGYNGKKGLQDLITKYLE